MYIDKKKRATTEKMKMILFVLNSGVIYFVFKIAKFNEEKKANDFYQFIIIFIRYYTQSINILK